MRVTFGTTGELRQYVMGSSRSVEVNLPPGAKIGDLLVHLGITGTELGTLAVNGWLADEGSELHEDDHVEFIIPLGGG